MDQNNSEKLDFGYTGVIAIPAEVKALKTTFLRLGGVSLTLRQTALSTLALVIFAGCFYAGKTLGCIDAGMIAGVLIAVPLGMIAFVSRHGMAMEDWMLVRAANRHYSTAVRKAAGMDEYEKLEDLIDHADAKAARKARKREKKIPCPYPAFR